MVKCALVCGAGGFIGGHLVKRLKRDGLDALSPKIYFNGIEYLPRPRAWSGDS
jgi:nucleoside-diphosphate-sugar epimerase